MGSANSVQAYCRLPIITMPTKADHNRTQRLIVLSSASYPPLCTGWRTGNHTASPQARHGPASLASLSGRGTQQWKIPPVEPCNRVIEFFPTEKEVYRPLTS